MIDASAYRTEWARTIKGGSLEQFRQLPRPSYEWVFDITVRDGKVAHIREYIDTQALARASQMDASGLSTLTTQYPAMRIDASFDDRLTDLVDTGLDAVVRIGDPNRFTGADAFGGTRRGAVICGRLCSLHMRARRRRFAATG